MGRNSDECGASVDTFILTHRIRQQAGHRFECVLPRRWCEAENLHHAAKPVGDVRGYEGSESGVSADTFILTHHIRPTAIRGKPAATVSARISLNRAHRTASNACSSE